MKSIVLIVTVIGLFLYSSPIIADHGRLVQSLGKHPRIHRSPETGDISSIGRVRISPSKKVASPVGAAEQFIGKYGSLFGIEKGVQKVVYHTTYNHLNHHLLHCRFHIDTFPIFLERGVIQVDEEGRIRRVTFPSFEEVNGPLEHPLKKPSTRLPFAALHGYDEYPEGVPGWMLDKESAPVAVIRFETPEKGDGEPLSLYVAAQTGRIVRSEPLRSTGDPEGLVLLENPITTPIPSLVSLPYLDPNSRHLEGDFAHVATCLDKEDCLETIPLATLREGTPDNFVYKPNFGEFAFEDPFAEVNAYYHVSKINAWIRQTFGWDGLFGKNTWIEVRVGRSWYNAAYYHATKKRDPFLMFGQDKVDLAYDSDVAYHEFGHAVNRTIWEHSWLKKDHLGIDVAMFGIEEAAADIWAQQFSKDPVMDNYVVESRSAQNTTTCPDDYVGEGHMEARILSAFAWDVSESIGSETFLHIFYRSLHFLSNKATFEEFARTLADSAEDLFGEGFPGLTEETGEIIREHAEKRGLTNEACLKRIVPMHEGRPRVGVGYGSSRTGKHLYPLGLQWKLTIPAGVKMFALFLKWRYPTEEDKDGVSPGYKVYLRRGAPVEVNWLDEKELEDGTEAFDAVADVKIEDAPEVVEFPFHGHEPLTPMEEIYVLLSSDTDESLFVMEAAVYFYENNASIPPLEENADSGPSPPRPSYIYNRSPQCSEFEPGMPIAGSRSETPFRKIYGVLSQILD